MTWPFQPNVQPASSSPVYPQNVVPAEASGGVYPCAVTPIALTSAALTANRFYALPFITREGGLVSNIVFENNSAGETGFNIRTGIYTDSVGSPGALVAESSVATLTAAAAIRQPANTATLNPNTRYWAAMLCDNAATLTTCNSTNTTMAAIDQTSFGMLLWKNSITGAGSNAGLWRALAYGALPASWGTPTNAIGVAVPFIAWRKA
jgi:hypothetical protein